MNTLVLRFVDNFSEVVRL